MSRARTYSTRAMEKILAQNGFRFIRCSGSHKIYKKDTQTIVINPNINKMVALRIIKENKLYV